MNDKRILKNIGISMIMKPIAALLAIEYTSFILIFLGDSKYAVWQIILNIVSWINYFDIGIGNGLRNRLAESYALGKTEESKKYVSTAYFATGIISVVFCVIICGIWNLFDLSTFFDMNTSGESTNAAVTISVFFVCLNFILALSRTMAYAVQKPGITSVVDVIAQIVQILAVIIITRIINASIMVTAVVYGSVTLISNFCMYFIITYKKYDLKPSFKYIDMKSMKSLMTLGIGFFIIQISILVLNTTDNLLVSRLYGKEVVTPYSLIYKLFYLIVQGHSIIIMPMWSAYTEASAIKNVKWIKDTLKKINIITVLLSAGTIVFIFLFKPIARIWLHKDYDFDNRVIVVMAIFVIAQMFYNNYSSLVCGVGRIKASTILAAISSVVNIPLSIFLAKGLGLGTTGIILGSLAVMVMCICVLPFVARNWIREKEEEWQAEKPQTDNK